MPKLYEYLGIIVLFYSKEHYPIHVHGNYQGTECRAEIIVANGKITKVVFKKVKGKKQLPSSKLTAFKKLVNKYSEDIVKKWIDFFVYNKPVKPKRITKVI
ncbi:MAG: DUF4160 domain-containing protein [Ignavibacteria bacterium]|nr:DUF4160 domain-containing protein [Ignavibacteria bacterium]